MGAAAAAAAAAVPPGGVTVDPLMAAAEEAAADQPAPPSQPPIPPAAGSGRGGTPPASRPPSATAAVHTHPARTNDRLQGASRRWRLLAKAKSARLRRALRCSATQGTTSQGAHNPKSTVGQRSRPGGASFWNDEITAISSKPKTHPKSRPVQG